MKVTTMNKLTKRRCKIPVCVALAPECIAVLEHLAKAWKIPKAQGHERVILIVGAMSRNSICPTWIPMAEEYRLELLLDAVRNDQKQLKKKAA